jgi:hypothetical protein
MSSIAKKIECTKLIKVALKEFSNQKIIQFRILNGSILICCLGKLLIRGGSYSFLDREGIVHSTANTMNDLNYLSQSDLYWEEQEDNSKIDEKLTTLLNIETLDLTIDEVQYIDSSKYVITFGELEDFSLELFTKEKFGKGLEIESSEYKFYITNSKCISVKKTVKKDYKSFSSAAKSRFRKMAKELGYEQITGITYVKERDGWYETYNLQSSQYGNPFFYFNYGVILPEKFPMTREELRDSGWNLGGRLCPEDSNSFPAGNKKQIEESATLALELYKEKVVPWFESLTLEKIGKKINR